MKKTKKRKQNPVWAAHTASGNCIMKVRAPTHAAALKKFHARINGPFVA